jgi:hypothetical protein
MHAVCLLPVEPGEQDAFARHAGDESFGIERAPEFLRKILRAREEQQVLALVRTRSSEGDKFNPPPA